MHLAASSIFFAQRLPKRLQPAMNEPGHRGRRLFKPFCDLGHGEILKVVEDNRLARLGKTFPRAAAGQSVELQYAERPWLPGQGDADITWAVEKLVAVAQALR